VANDPVRKRTRRAARRVEWQRHEALAAPARAGLLRLHDQPLRLSANSAGQASQGAVELDASDSQYPRMSAKPP
jgi:hypothetical protein